MIAEPEIVERATLFGDRHFANGDVTNGFYVDMWTMVPGAGWISGGPGYRRWSSKDRVFFDTSAAISWNNFKTAQAQVELPRFMRSRLAVGSEVRWQNFPRLEFFGEGRDTPESDRSKYFLNSTNLLGYATFRPIRSVALDAQVGWLHADTRDTMAAGIRSAIPNDQSFVHTTFSATADVRDFPGHPTSGGLYRAAVANYSDRDSGTFTFRRYEAEGAHFVPFAGSRVVLALRGWVVSSDVDAGHAVPFYLLPSLGGHNMLRSYADYRFHDRHMALLNAEARIAMMTHVDAAIFVDAGNVAEKFSDLNLDKRSYGAGLRLHSRRQTFARVDVANGEEGWRVLFRLTDPLNLSRLTRRAATVPFVP